MKRTGTVDHTHLFRFLKTLRTLWRKMLTSLKAIWKKKLPMQVPFVTLLNWSFNTPNHSKAHWQRLMNGHEIRKARDFHLQLSGWTVNCLCRALSSPLPSSSSCLLLPLHQRRILFSSPQTLWKLFAGVTICQWIKNVKRGADEGEKIAQNRTVLYSGADQRTCLAVATIEDRGRSEQ